MDSVVLLIWLGNAIFYCRKQKTISIEQLLLGIIFLGGFIFHLFWEAKALYIMPYFILSIISGVQGIDFMFHKLSNWMKSYICKTVS